MGGKEELQTLTCFIGLSPLFFSLDFDSLASPVLYPLPIKLKSVFTVWAIKKVSERDHKKIQSESLSE